MLLSRPRARLNVIDRRHVPTPRHFAGDLDKLGVLHHHGMHNPQKRLIARKQRRPPRHRVPLHEALACMFRQHLDHAAAIAARVLVPLEIALRVLQHGIEFVAFQLVRGEEADCFGVGLEHAVEQLAGDFHAALRTALVYAELAPVDGLESDVGLVCDLELPELFGVLGGENVEDRVGGCAVGLQEVTDLVAG